MKRDCVLGIVLLITAAPLAAQRAANYTMPEEYREVQVRQLEAQRRLLTAMADSMPDRLYRDRATPAQRDFANQVYHAVSAVAGIAGRFILNTNPGISADTSRVLNRSEAMIAYINRVYDWAIQQVRSQPADARLENVALFGQNVPRWQVWDEIHQHTIWTAGQIVANFRKHGMAPPGFTFF